jgi:hypothetical protein
MRAIRLSSHTFAFPYRSVHSCFIAAVALAGAKNVQSRPRGEGMLVPRLTKQTESALSRCLLLNRCTGGYRYYRHQQGVSGYSSTGLLTNHQLLETLDTSTLI